MSRMFKDKKTEILVGLALEKRMERDIRMMGLEPVEPHVFSEEHNQRMKQVFEMARKAEKRAARRRLYSRIAAGLAVFFCLSTVMVSQVEAFRLPVLQFFMETKEKFTTVGSREKSRLGLSEKYWPYEPVYVPEGYVAVSVSETESGFDIKYEKATDHKWYTYYYWSSRERVDIDTENGEVWEETINGKSALVVQKEDEIRIIMSNGLQRFLLNGTISYKEARKILESLQ